MKKVLSFFGAALFVAAMTVSCGNNKNAEVEEAVDETIENVAEEASAVVSEATVEMTDAARQAMLDAAREAGRAKCNCYKTDAASVEACIKSIISQSYAAYQDNAEFKAAMEAEFNACVKEKATEAVKDAAEDATKKAASAIANKLGGK